jgi:hypothetical protein
MRDASSGPRQPRLSASHHWQRVYVVLTRWSTGSEMYGFRVPIPLSGRWVCPAIWDDPAAFSSLCLCGGGTAFRSRQLFSLRACHSNAVLSEEPALALALYGLCSALGVLLFLQDAKRDVALDCRERMYFSAGIIDHNCQPHVRTNFGRAGAVAVDRVAAETDGGRIDPPKLVTVPFESAPPRPSNVIVPMPAPGMYVERSYAGADAGDVLRIRKILE